MADVSRPSAPRTRSSSRRALEQTKKQAPCAASTRRERAAAARDADQGLSKCGLLSHRNWLGEKDVMHLCASTAFFFFVVLGFGRKEVVSAVGVWCSSLASSILCFGGLHGGRARCRCFVVHSVVDVLHKIAIGVFFFFFCFSSVFVSVRVSSRDSRSKDSLTERTLSRYLECGVTLSPMHDVRCESPAVQCAWARSQWRSDSESLALYKKKKS